MACMAAEAGAGVADGRAMGTGGGEPGPDGYTCLVYVGVEMRGAMSIESKERWLAACYGLSILLFMLELFQDGRVGLGEWCMELGIMAGALVCFWYGILADSWTALRAELLLVAKMRMMGVEPVAGDDGRVSWWATKWAVITDAQAAGHLSADAAKGLLEDIDTVDSVFSRLFPPIRLRPARRETAEDRLRSLARQLQSEAKDWK